MGIKAEKYTGVEAMRRHCAASTGKQSHMTLAKGYALGHSFIRSQRFYITLEDIPQFVANQLVRQRVGVDWTMFSKRTDRGGGDFTNAARDAREGMWDVAADMETALEKADDAGMARAFDRLSDLALEVGDWPERFDRLAPTTLFGDINAEALMNMAHKRLCGQASPETRAVVRLIREKVGEADPDLAAHMVPQCIWRGGICPEARCCGYICSGEGRAQLRLYKNLFHDPAKA